MGLRHERLLNTSTGLGVDLHPPHPHVVPHRRVRDGVNVVLVDQAGQHPPGGMPLFTRSGQVLPQHRVDQRLDRIQLRRRLRPALTRRRHRRGQRLPHRPPMHPIPPGQRPNRQIFPLAVPTDRFEQTHPAQSQPGPFRWRQVRSSRQTGRGGAIYPVTPLRRVAGGAE